MYIKIIKLAPRLIRKALVNADAMSDQDFERNRVLLVPKCYNLARPCLYKYFCASIRRRHLKQYRKPVSKANFKVPPSGEQVNDFSLFFYNSIT
jgi:hypothetical protein